MKAAVWIKKSATRKSCPIPHPSRVISLELFKCAKTHCKGALCWAQFQSIILTKICCNRLHSPLSLFNQRITLNSSSEMGGIPQSLKSFKVIKILLNHSHASNKNRPPRKSRSSLRRQFVCLPRNVFCQKSSMPKMVCPVPRRRLNEG